MRARGRARISNQEVTPRVVRRRPEAPGRPHLGKPRGLSSSPFGFFPAPAMATGRETTARARTRAPAEFERVSARQPATSDDGHRPLSVSVRYQRRYACRRL